MTLTDTQVSRSVVTPISPQSLQFSMNSNQEHPVTIVQEVAGKTESKQPRPRRRGYSRKELGRKGEEAAVRFLYNRGYEIIQRNWTCFAGEADIIAKDGETLVFVEVKTRSGCEQGFPGEAVTLEKRDRYEKIALAFLSDYEIDDAPVRFDVISLVVVSPNRALVRHHINAFCRS